MKSDVIVHIREAFGIRDRTAFYLMLGVIEVAGIGVLLAGRSDRIEAVAGLTTALFALLISARWPLIPLFAFAAIIPMEEVVKIGDVATASKALGLLFAVSYALPRIGGLRISAMPKAAYAYIAWAILSVGWAIQPAAYFSEIPTLVQLFVISVLVADVVVHRPAIVRPLLWAYSLGAGLTALIGIAAYLTGAVASGQRVTAFADQDAGQFALLLLPALVFALYELSSGRLIAPSAIVVGLTSVAILMSGTRGAWLGISLVVLVFLLPRLGWLRGIVALGLIGITLVVALQLPGVSDLVLQRTELALPTGGAGRADIWTVGLQIFDTAPITGVGYANFPIAYTPDLVAQAGVTGYTDPAFGSHSIIVGTFGELGIVGAVCLILFVGPLLARRGWGPDGPAVQAMLAAMLTAALFIDVLNRKQVWLVLGIAAGLAYLRRHQPSAVAAEPGLPVPVKTAALHQPLRPEPPVRPRLPVGRVRLRTPRGGTP
jgi:exopolysaccharide production protein ExoQ